VAPEQRDTQTASGSFASLEQQVHEMASLQRVRRGVLPRVYADSSSRDETSCPAHRSKQSRSEPLEYCILLMRQKEGYIRGLVQNPSGWYHENRLTKMD
jgi:hypothetical protein